MMGVLAVAEEIEELNKTVAYRKKPIYLPEGMERPIQECIVMEAEWKGRIKENWWASNSKSSKQEILTKALNVEHRAMLEKMFLLRDRLLAFGGEEVCLPWTEGDIDNILSRGQLWHGKNPILQKGSSNQCHRNSCDLWYANKDHPTAKMYIATGYALSRRGGMWRQHSWCLWVKPRSVRVVETTTPRIAYYGFAMTDEETRQFDEDNF